MDAGFINTVRKISARLRRRLNRVPPGRLILLLLLQYGVVLLAITAPYDFNPSVLARFGHYYIEQNSELAPPGAVRFLGNEAWGGNGYDGQIFYYYARSLFQKGRWPKGFSDAYRAPRIGYPFLAALFSPGGSWGVLLGMIIVQLLLIPLSLYFLYYMLPADRRYLAFFYLLSPFLLQSCVVLVSDSVMLSLAVIGLYFYSKMYGAESASNSALTNLVGAPGTFLARPPGARIHYGATLLAYACFSFSILSKESALFLLFPLGLHALFRRDLPRILLMLGALLPMALWQLYLRTAHGMVPAGILKIFLSPFDGILGLFATAGSALLDFIARPSVAALVALFKLGAKLLLFLLIPTALVAVFTGERRRFLPFRLGVCLALMSVIIADYYYFWGIYENISRMFTPLVALVILLKMQDPDTRTWPFFTVLSALAVMVLVRLTLLSPVFPHDTYRPYRGPDHSNHALPAPGSARNR